MIKLLMTFVVLLGSLSVSYAEGLKNVLLTDIPKLNREVALTKPDFEAQTNLIQEIPMGNKFLAYRVRLPKTWEKLDIKGDGEQSGISGQLLGDVAQYLGPPTLDIRGVFRIRANALAYDITAKDWFLSYVYGNNFTLQGLDVSSERRVQAQYIMVENGEQSIVRAVAEITGSRMILAEYILPIELWQTERDFAKRAMGTFVLTSPDPAQIELMQTYSFVDIAKFSYPASWILGSPPIRSIERMNASLTNLKGGAEKKTASTSQDLLLMDGRIDLSVVTKNPDTNIAKELAGIRKQMGEKGLVLGELIEPIEGWPHNDAIIFSKIEAYKVNNVQNGLAEYEQWIGVFETSGRYYFLRLLTVGRNDDFLIWARNTRAYKKVIASLSPVN